MSGKIKTSHPKLIYRKDEKSHIFEMKCPAEKHPAGQDWWEDARFSLRCKDRDFDDNQRAAIMALIISWRESIGQETEGIDSITKISNQITTAIAQLSKSRASDSASSE